MTMQQIGREVAMMLDQVDQRIAEAEAKLAKGADRQKVEAAGELAFLKRQQASLKHRLDEIRAHPDSPQTLFQWLREEVLNLTMRLDGWVAGG
ncbi:MAG TPA: hypothetical protein VG939_17695 [Caulobacteraceae bacterium]|nr:hypothetical protein [Caulobacteraceae bacterium]